MQNQFAECAVGCSVHEEGLELIGGERETGEEP